MEVLRPAKKVKANLELHTERSGESNNAVTGTKPLEITPEFFKQETWKQKVIPTLCLWTAAQSNIWGISKEQIMSTLKDIVAAAYPKSPELVEQVTLQSKLVAVVSLNPW